jgi:hypothetical protein
VYPALAVSAAANSASYGVGFADSADHGNPAGLSSDTIEIKYALLGDANLDGVVNGVDFGILAANFNKGAVSASDLAALTNFAAANGLLSDIPEPASVVLLCATLTGALSRRSRTRRKSTA